MNIIELMAETSIAESVGNSLLLLDIDDTLLTAQNIYIHKILPSGKIEKLTPEQYAAEDTKKQKASGVKYSYEEFNDPKKVAKSIKTGIPIIPNLSIMDSYIKNGWRIGILTARGLEDVIADSMKKWLMHKDEKGKLRNIGDKLVRELIFAINDSNKRYAGEGDFDKKKNVIKKLAKQFDRIVFIDDDPKNLKAVKDMVEREKIKNVYPKEAKKSES